MSLYGLNKIVIKLHCIVLLSEIPEAMIQRWLFSRCHLSQLYSVWREKERYFQLQVIEISNQVSPNTDKLFHVLKGPEVERAIGWLSQWLTMLSVLSFSPQWLALFSGWLQDDFSSSRAYILIKYGWQIFPFYGSLLGARKCILEAPFEAFTSHSQTTTGERNEITLK